MANVDQPFVFQRRVRLHDGVRADDELLREHAQTRQGVARLQHAGFDRVANLLDELQVDRLSCRLVDDESHGRQLYHSSDTVGRGPAAGSSAAALMNEGE